MAYFMVAVLVGELYTSNKRDIIGYRIIGTDSPKFSLGKPCYIDIKADRLKSGKYSIENLRLDGDSLISTGSISRYPKISLSGELLSKPSYTVLYVKDDEVILSNAIGIVSKHKTSDLYRKGVQLTNAKLVKTKNKIIIASLPNGSLLRQSASAKANTSKTSNTFTKKAASKTSTTSTNHLAPTKNIRKYKLDNSLCADKASNWSFNTSNGTAVSITYDVLSTEDMASALKSISYIGNILDDSDDFGGACLRGLHATKITLNNKRQSQFYSRDGWYIGNELYFCGWVLDNKESRDFSGAIGVSEISTQDKERYLLIYSDDCFGWNTKKHMVLYDILHIGKKYIKFGASEQEQKASYNSNDSSIIGLGLYGLVMIEYTSDKPVLSCTETRKLSLTHKPNKIWENFDIKCIPYNKLNSHGDIINALSSLRTLDRKSISSADIGLILNAKYHIKSYKDDFSILESLDSLPSLDSLETTKYTYGSSLKQADAVIDIVRYKNIQYTSYSSFSRERYNNGILNSSKLNELEASIGNHFGCIHTSNTNKLYLNCTDFHNIDGVRLPHNDVRLMTCKYLHLRMVGYIGLYKYGKVTDIYTEWVTDSVLKSISNLIWKVSLSGGTLEIGYASYLITYNYSELMRLYTHERDLILSNSEIYRRFNSKQAMIGKSFRIDRAGIIIDCLDGEYIEQSKHIKGIDLCAIGDKEVYVELKDSLLVLYRVLNGTNRVYNKLNLVIKKGCLDSIGKLKCGSACQCAGAIIFDFDGITSPDELYKMLGVYLCFAWSGKVYKNTLVRLFDRFNTTYSYLEYTLDWFMCNLHKFSGKLEDFDVLYAGRSNNSWFLGYGITVASKNISKVDDSISISVLNRLSKLNKYLNTKDDAGRAYREVFYRSLQKWLIDK